MTKRPIGWCNICGTHGELSPEHIPPRKAFNNNEVFEGYLDWSTWNFVKTGKSPQSIKYSICGFCNNLTSDYAQTYVNVAKQAAIYVDRMPVGANANMIIHDFYPLRLIKSIVTMIFVVNEFGFREKHPALVNFVMNKDIKSLPPKYKVYMNLASGTMAKFMGVAGEFNIYNSRSVVSSCVEFKPLSVAVSFNDPHENYYDISHLSNFGYREKRTSTAFKVKKLDIDDKSRIII